MTALPGASDSEPGLPPCPCPLPPLATCCRPRLLLRPLPEPAGSPAAAGTFSGVRCSSGRLSSVNAAAGLPAAAASGRPSVEAPTVGAAVAPLSFLLLRTLDSPTASLAGLRAAVHLLTGDETAPGWAAAAEDVS